MPKDGLIAHGLKEAPPPTDCEKSDEYVLKKFLERQEKESKARWKDNDERSKHATATRKDGGSEDEEEDSDEDDDDDEFLRRYKEQRISEMKNKAQQSETGEESSPEEGLTTLISLEFKDKVVMKSQKSPVVMLLFSGSKECDTMIALIKPLVPKFPKVSFVKMHCSDAAGVPKEDCPVLMVYIGGKVIGQFAKLKSFYGPKTTSEVIEYDLARLGVLETTLEEDPRPRFKMRR
mmetsp:Transcript_16289/g.22842  ORF Transcript_16289/g.22842 Transcript_16289/m.22842 type:complete len:234 (-) Transcript_16289:120-821(-)